MANLTLMEAAKNEPKGRERAIIEVYGSSYHPWMAAPVVTNETGTKDFTIYRKLPATSPRAVNADFTATNAEGEPYSAQSKAYGGKVQVDDYIVEHRPSAVQNQKKQQINSYARGATVDIFEGQGGTAVKGIRQYIRDHYSGTQEIKMGSTDGGDPPTMAKMDELVDAVNIIPGRTFIYSNQKPFTTMNVLSRTASAGQQNIQYVKSDFGTRIPFYNNIPWVVMKDGKGEDILSTVEDEHTTVGTFTGGTTATSIYCVTWGEDLCEIFGKSRLPKVKNDSDGTNFHTFRIDHYFGFAQALPRAAARLYNVANT